jgi:hypothetical protein
MLPPSLFRNGRHCTGPAQSDLVFSGALNKQLAGFYLVSPQVG